MTTIVFFVDEHCSDRGNLNNVTGPPTGYCTAFGVESYGSFRVETLERTCAVTIYDRDEDYCSSSKLSVASFGECLTNTTVAWMSNDCQDYGVATSDAPASYVPAPTRSTTPSSAAASASAESASQDGDTGLSTGAQAGIGIGVALLVLGIIGVAAFLFLRRRRRASASASASANANASAEASPDGDVKELHGSTRGPTEMPLWQDEKKDAAMTGVKDQPQPYTYPVEAPGDAHWPGRMHEMDANSVRTHEMSSETEVNTNTNTNTNSNTNNSTRRS